MAESCDQAENFECFVSNQEMTEFKNIQESNYLDQKEHCVKCSGKFVEQQNHLLSGSLQLFQNDGCNNENILILECYQGWPRRLYFTCGFETTRTLIFFLLMYCESLKNHPNKSCQFLFYLAWLLKQFSDGHGRQGNLRLLP